MDKPKDDETHKKTPVPYVPCMARPLKKDFCSNAVASWRHVRYRVRSLCLTGRKCSRDEACRMASCTAGRTNERGTSSSKRVPNGVLSSHDEERQRLRRADFAWVHERANLKRLVDHERPHALQAKASLLSGPDRWTKRPAGGRHDRCIGRQERAIALDRRRRRIQLRINEPDLRACGPGRLTVFRLEPTQQVVIVSLLQHHQCEGLSAKMLHRQRCCFVFGCVAHYAHAGRANDGAIRR